MAASERARSAAGLLSAPGPALTVLLFLLSLLYYYLFYDHGFIPNDEGHLVHFSERVYQGEVPGRDFHLETYIFGRYFLLAFLFHLFGGPHLLIERMMWVVLRALCVVLHFSLGRRLMPTSYALVPSLFLMIVPGPWHKTPYTFCCLIGLLVLFVFLKRNSLFWIGICGIVAGLSLQLRQDIGLLILGTLGLFIFLASLEGTRVEKGHATPFHFGSRLGRAALGLFFYLFVVTATLAPAAIMLWTEDGLGPVLKQCFVEKFEQHLGLFNFTSRLGRMWESGDHLGFIYFCIPPLIFFSTGILLARRMIRRQFTDDFMPLAALFLVAVLSMNQAYNHALVIRLLQCGAPTYLLGMYLLYRAGVGIQSLSSAVGKAALPWTRAGIPAIAGILALAVALEIMTSGRESNLGVEYRGSIATYSKDDITLESPRAGVMATPRKTRLFNKTTAFRMEITEPDEPIYVACNDSILYFLTERSNPSRYAKFFMPGEPEARKRRILEEIKKNPTRFIVSTGRLMRERRDHPAVKYINDNYLIFKEIDTKYQKTFILYKRKEKSLNPSKSKETRSKWKGY